MVWLSNIRRIGIELPDSVDRYKYYDAYSKVKKYLSFTVRAGRRGNVMSGTRSHPEPLDELKQLARWLRSGKSVALATVVRTWGSSPRPLGSHLAVNGEGHFAGSVSGGCIEGAVVGEALDIINSGKPRLLEFGVSNDQAWEVGLSCGGVIHVYVEAIGTDALRRLLDDCENKRPVARVTRLTDGRQSLVYESSWFGDLPLSEKQLLEAQSLLRIGCSGMSQQSEEATFVRSYLPPARMIIVGAVHIAQVLAPMASVAGFDVTIVDPRTAFCRKDRFPGVTLSNDWPDEALDGMDLDRQTAVVTLSHDPKIDDPALTVALKSAAFYIGALGSSRTHARRVERLTESGLGDQLARIHAPVGIQLGGRAPAEIAVSILAEAIQARYGFSQGEGNSTTAETRL